MRPFLALVFSLVLAVQSLAQTNAPASAPATNSSGPRIAFDQTSFNFGKVESGEPVKHTYYFTNVGNATLEVVDVRPGCGCTTAGAWDKKVEPGKTGAIPIQFNSAAYSGGVSKNITVTCNDSSQKTVMLFLNGTIWKSIEVQPSVASFLLPPENQTKQTQVLKIVNNLDEPLNIAATTNQNPAFEVQFKTNTPGKEFEFRITVIPPVGEGTLSARYDFATSSSKVPLLNIMVFATGQPVLALMPNQLNLPPGPLQAVSQQNVTIQNNSTNSLVLSEPILLTKAGLSPTMQKVEGVDIQVKETNPGRIFVATLNFPAGFKIEPGKTMELHLKSNLPRNPTVVVAVYQPPPPPTIAVPPASPQVKQGS